MSLQSLAQFIVIVLLTNPGGGENRDPGETLGGEELWIYTDIL